MPHIKILRASAILGLLMAGSVVAADRGQELASTVCVACHGVDGNSLAPAFPKLAGLQKEYLAKQLVEYIDGKRKSDVMAPIVADLKRSDVTPLATYYSLQKPASGNVADAALAERGRTIYVDGNLETGVPACMGCHQEDGSGNPRNPRLAGQHQSYLIDQLRQFRDGTRSNDRARVMRTIASRLDDAEARAVAEYIAGLPSLSNP